MSKRAAFVLALLLVPGSVHAWGWWWRAAPQPPQRSIEANLKIIRASKREADRWDRWSALHDIGRQGSLQAAQTLLSFIDDPQLDGAAVSALVHLKDQQAVPALVAKLADRRDWVRYGLCVALGEIGGSQAVAALLKVARDDGSKTVRVTATEALATELVRNPTAALVQGLLGLATDDTLQDDALAVLDGFRSQGQAALLHPGLTSPTAKVRGAICGLLGWLGNPASTDPLIALLAKETEAEVRASAVAALASVFSPDQFERVLAVFKRLLAPGASPKEALSALTAALRKRTEPLDGKLAEELARLVVRWLGDADEDLRWSATILLERVGHPLAAPGLRKMIKSEASSYPRAAAHKALAAVLNQGQDVQLLVERASQGDDAQAAREALAQVRQPAVVKALIDALRSEVRWVRLAVVESLEAIGRPEAALPLATLAVEDREPSVREAAARAAGALGDARVLPVLAGGLKQRRPAVPLVEAFLRLDRREGFPQSKALLKHNDESMTWVLDRWETVLPVDEAVLLQAAKSPSAALRGSAVAPLARLDSPAAREFLCTLLRGDPEFQLRVEAAKAMAREPALASVRCLATVLGTLSHNDINVREAVQRALQAMTGQRDGTSADWKAWKEGKAGLGQGLAGLLAALASPSVELQLLAARELARWPNAAERSQALLPLMQRLTKERIYDARLQSAWVEALGATADPAAIGTIAKILAERRGGRPAELVPAAKALHALGDPRGLEALIRALDAPGAEDRRAACEALAVVSGEKLHYDALRWRAWWKRLVRQ